MALPSSSAAGNASYTATNTATPTGTYNGPPPSLITQFVQPASCASLFAVFSTEFPTNTINPTTTTFFTSDASNPSFSTCQPSGWDQASFSFSPAVCPSSWTYFSMSTTIYDKVPVSVAACCARFVHHITFEKKREYKLIFPSSFANSGYELEIGHRYYTDGYACVTSTRNPLHTAVTASVHSPWHVAWQASDTTKFSFSLPSIPTGSSIESWAPGQTPWHDNSTNDSASLGVLLPLTLGLTLGIGLPVLCLIVGVPWYLVVRNRRRKRALQHEQSGTEMTAVSASTTTISVEAQRRE